MSQDAHTVIDWLGLGCIPGVGRVTFRRLVDRFGSPGGALAATLDELRSVDGLPDKVAQNIRSHPWREWAEAELDRAAAAGAAIITADDDAFPGALRDTPDPPLVLYIRGRLLPGDAVAAAIVGTRTPTQYGLTVTRRMASELAAAGVTIVSGLARGIDTQAHRSALAARGRTIAVLGSGIDVVYPSENRELMDRITENGAVVSENPVGTKPESGYFPARNRIISGLARGTVVIEAAEDSGSLVTADYAVKQGRKLFAVPGNAGTPMSRGTNSLIKQGAVLAESAGDVLQHLGRPRPQESGSPALLPPLSAEESRLFGALTAEPMHIDALLGVCGAPAGILSGILISLELKGLVRQLPGKYFIRTR